MSIRPGHRGTVVPVRDKDRENASSGSSEVKTWKMSPEELEDYRARTGYMAPTDVVGKEISQPVQINRPRPDISSEEQLKRAAGRKPSAKEPDKQAFLVGIADGKTIVAMEKAFGMKTNCMYYWLKKWGLVGISPGKARELLDPNPSDEKEEAVPVTEQIAHESLRLHEEKIADLTEALRVRLSENDRLTERMTEVQLQATKAWSELKDLRPRVISYEENLNAWAQRDTESRVRISDLEEDRDQWKRQAAINKSTRDILQYSRDEALQAIAELEDEKRILLATLEAAAEDAIEQVFESENVNYPAHYTAGGIECIDAIDAALIGLTGGQAYSTGAAIKYLWRWSRKNGLEDLEKAAWYVNRLISEIAVTRFLK